MKKQKLTYNSIELDFYNFYKLATDSSDPAAWQAALAKIQSVPKNSTLLSIIDKTIIGSSGIPAMLKVIEETGVGPAAINGLIRIGKGVGAVTASGLDADKIQKFSSIYLNSDKRRQEQLLKQAGITDTIGDFASNIGSGISGLVGSLGDIAGTVTKLLPYAATIYKGITGVMALISAFQSYKSLVEEASGFGIEWYETLMPWKLTPLFEQNKSDPEKMGSLGFICGIASKFIKDGLISIIRVLVASKEAFNIIIEVLKGEQAKSAGLLGSLEPFLPIIQLVVEWGAGKLLTYGHESLLGQILDVVNSHIGGEATTSAPTLAPIPAPAT